MSVEKSEGERDSDKETERKIADHYLLEGMKKVRQGYTSECVCVKNRERERAGRKQFRERDSERAIYKGISDHFLLDGYMMKR